jgi:prepilin-type N-terminal cleavage/methylation domain-containing protein
MRINIVKGFTLIETVVVLGILGIVAGLAVPSLMGLSDEREIKEQAFDIARYVEKIRLCALTATNKSARLEFYRQSDKYFMKGVCEDAAGNSMLSKFGHLEPVKFDNSAQEIPYLLFLNGVGAISSNPAAPNTIDFSSSGSLNFFKTTTYVSSIGITDGSFKCDIPINMVGTGGWSCK